jgi:hypothetical protein
MHEGKSMVQLLRNIKQPKINEKAKAFLTTKKSTRNICLGFMTKKMKYLETLK